MKNFKQEKNLDVAFAYHIQRTARLLRHHFIKTMREHGHDLNPEQWFILNRIWKNKNLKQIDLTDEYFKDKANITRILNSLLKKGWVIRERDINDKRAFALSLSIEGKNIMEKFWDIALKARDDVYKDLNLEELNQLKKILFKLEKNLTIT